MRNLLSILLAAALLLLCLSTGAIPAVAAATEGFYTYTVTDGKATITDVDTSISGDVTIPSTLGGYPVAGIGDSAFSNCTLLTSATISDGVTNISARAFSGCKKLTSVVFPDGVRSIFASTFHSCTSLTSVIIPNSVTSIGVMAFYGCTALATVHYFGTWNEWNAIDIKSSNDYMKRASRHYCEWRIRSDVICGSPSVVEGYCSTCRTVVAQKEVTFVHNWQDANCVFPTSCTICGATEGSALGHNWRDANCGAPKTCTVCGATEGNRLGDHNWTDGGCTVCKQKIYTIAEDFYDADVTGTEGSWSLVSGKSPFGQALWFGRENSSVNVTIKLDKEGTATQKAIVFYYDNTESGNDGEAYFKFCPYNSEGVGIVLGANYAYQAVIGEQLIDLMPSSNMALKLPKQTSGWVILPLPAKNTWQYNYVSGAAYYGTTEDIASVYLEFSSFSKASIIVDQFGFTENIETFIAAAQTGNEVMPGYMIGCGSDHTWVNATCTTPKTCTVCGETIGEPTSHRWQPATCTTPKSCMLCGMTTGDLQHTWKEANCNKPITCVVCGVTDGIPLGHCWEDGACIFCYHTHVDADENGFVTVKDAVYLLYHTMLPEQYPLDSVTDIDCNGVVDGDDAIYLLYYCLLPDQYPLA